MRADMAKVIVERPRYGSSDRGKGKCYRRRLQRMPTAELPHREGMKRYIGDRKGLNEHLGPLRRYLLANVGRPWDKVFSEICRHINRNSAVQDHVRDHVDDYVVRHVVLIDGVPCYGGCEGFGRKYGMPLDRWSSPLKLYVCPRTGLLRKVERPRRIRENRKPLPRYVRLGADEHYCFVDGAWHAVRLELFPNPESARQWDVVFGRDVSCGECGNLYGLAVYAIAKRRLSKREARNLPLPLSP